MSEVIATVPFLSGRVYVLSAVFVLVKNAENVLATFRSANIPARNVFIPVENVAARVSDGMISHSTAITPAEDREIVVSAFHTSTLPVTLMSQ